MRGSGALKKSQAWVNGCIDKVKPSDDWNTLWNKAWFETYVELGT